MKKVTLNRCDVQCSRRVIPLGNVEGERVSCHALLTLLALPKEQEISKRTAIGIEFTFASVG